MSFSTSSSKTVMSEMNVTPLVDVMLVLLVVFIVTAPLLSPQALKVDLPKTAAISKKDENKNAQLIVSKDGSLIYRDKPVTDQELIAEFKNRASDKNYQLQVHADKKAEYGRIAELIALAQANGVTKLSFVTLSKSDSNESKENKESKESKK